MGLFSKNNQATKKSKATKPASLKIAQKDATSKSETKTTTDKFHGNTYKHLIKPLITEKASFLGSYNQYVFEVAVDSNKIEIAKAIKSLYGVKPLKINLIKNKGKYVRYGRSYGKKKNWKKAIVFLKPEDKINVYEGV